jgi:hypothetical protein
MTSEKHSLHLLLTSYNPEAFCEELAQMAQLLVQMGGDAGGLPPGVVQVNDFYLALSLLFLCAAWCSIRLFCCSGDGETRVKGFGVLASARKTKLASLLSFHQPEPQSLLRK